MHRLVRGREQPRKAIDLEALTKLAQSIKSQGVIQPLCVRRVGLGRFEIVAGERRWRAAKMAGLKDVPTLVTKVSDQASLALALVENLHREDLNPIDQACALNRLITEFSMTHRDVAEIVGRSRAWVSNRIRLLELPQDVQTLVVNGEIDACHARALLALPVAEQPRMAQRVLAERPSVRELESLARERAERPNSIESVEREQEADRPVSPPELRMLERERVSVVRGADTGWQLRIDFKDLGDLERALDELADVCEGMRREERGRSNDESVGFFAGRA